MFTRTQYLKGECTHEQYYAQFVDDNIKGIVLRMFDYDTLREAYQKDTSFNTLPLYHWDALSHMFTRKDLMTLCGDIPTLAGKVCILKEAAREIVTGRPE